MIINGEYFKNEKEYLEHMKKIHKLCEEIIKKEESRGRKMREYKLFIRKYNFIKNDYEVVEKIVKTNDIYHEIGYIYCTTLEEIKRIDYTEIKEGK